MHLKIHKREVEMPTAFCPNCDEEITLQAPRLGQVVICPSCGTELEVVSVKPLELDFLFEEEEEWEEEWGEEEEEEEEW
jgi:alpha-aminoadipate carrier protein LysW